MKNKLLKSIGIFLPMVLLVSAFKSVPGGDTSKVKLTYADDDKSIFWEISGNGLKKPSFLYGTIHIQDKRVFQFDKQVTKAFAACDAYAMELKMDDINPLEMASMLIMKDTTLDMLLTEGEMQELDDSLQAKMGASAQLFNTMKPFFVSSQFSLTEGKKEMSKPLDLYLDSIAKAEKKIRIGIEEFKDQLGVIDEIPLQTQADLLMGVVRDTSNQDLLEDMIATYLSGDVEKMLTMGDEDLMPEGFTENFLNKRNRKMANRIAAISQEQTTFNAVGAAHLGGEQGVVTLLRKKGYTVRAIAIEFKAPK